MSDENTIYQRPVELMQNLIRFDTTNPPGNEADCVAYIARLLASVGIESAQYSSVEGRPNLVARLTGSGNAPPLLLQGHVDVVTTEGQDWTYPPFAAEIHDGMVWGRGTIDMKHGVAMMLAAFMRAKVENLTLPGDVILCILADEEAAGTHGAKYMVEHQAELFEGARYGIGETGGYSIYMDDRVIYPLQVAEKHNCWTRITLSGPGGHGARPLRSPEAATAKLGKLLTALNTHRLPVHITEPARLMIEAFADVLAEPSASALRALLDPQKTDATLDAMGPLSGLFDAILHNTVSPNVIRGGGKTNVIPSQIHVELDGRLVPGQTPEDFIAEVRALTGVDFDYEIINTSASAPDPDMGLFDTLSDILKEADPD
ncbi:MAG: M20/M25/M40 family metallo-hydrolase, partial [Chloroflexota bacterium]